jgi:transposase
VWDFCCRVLIAETGPVSERVRVREIDDDEGRRLVRIVRRGSGSVVTWRRAQMVLLSAQGMDVAAIARVAFTSEDRVRDVIRNFNADGFGSLYPKYKGGRAPKFALGQRREVKKIAKSRPADYDLPFSTWSLAKLADFLVAEGVVDDISHEGLRALLREEGVTFQRLKTWKASKDPRYRAKKARVEHLYAIGPADAAEEDLYYGIAYSVAGMLGWLVRHEPAAAGHVVGAVTGEAKRRLGIPRAVTEHSIRVALGLDGELETGALNAFLSRVLTPAD